MPKKLTVPHENKIAELGNGWNLYRHVPGPNRVNSPLWVPVRVINPGRRRRRGRLRGFWLYWGVDEGRFRRSQHQRRLADEQPAAYAAAVKACSTLLAPAVVEDHYTPTFMAEERARLARSKALHAQHNRTRMEMAHTAAQAEDAQRSKPQPPSQPPLTLDDLM